MHNIFRCTSKPCRRLLQRQKEEENREVDDSLPRVCLASLCNLCVLSLQNLTVDDVASVASTACYVRQKVRHKSLQLPLPGDGFPSLIPAPCAISGLDVHQSDAHVVPDDAELPVERNESGCFQSSGTPEVQLAVDVPAP